MGAGARFRDSVGVRADRQSSKSLPTRARCVADELEAPRCACASIAETRARRGNRYARALRCNDDGCLHSLSARVFSWFFSLPGCGFKDPRVLIFRRRVLKIQFLYSSSSSRISSICNQNITHEFHLTIQCVILTGNGGETHYREAKSRSAPTTAYSDVRLVEGLHIGSAHHG